MKKVLILFAHPRFENSRVNRQLISTLNGHDQITIHDLYEHYPDFNVDISVEKQLLTEHDIIVWQYPIYMYSAPALTKQWIDLVLEFGWAHGAGGDFLQQKIIFNAVTAAGTRLAYSRDGFSGSTIREFLLPFEQTAKLCKMTYIPPFVVHGTHLLTDTQLNQHALDYLDVLKKLADPAFDRHSLMGYDYLNDWGNEMTRQVVS